MAKRRIALELGQGTSIRSMDYTAAAVRAVKDALWRNSLSAADAFGFDRSAMLVDVEIGVQNPDAVDVSQVAAVFPYGVVTVLPKLGGLDVPKHGKSGHLVVAVAAVSVHFDMEQVCDEEGSTK